ncbi:Beta-amylase 8 [Acorus calamus]|uniref:Beta-amylase n=1 Tax=Acorus calamus TaxID=4465 RepID=A0AAV9E075_ACOCL|nr:Beta-amylase 8 [Acorus calamus]
MATMNAFDLLGDDDNDDLTQLIQKVDTKKASATPPAGAAPAKLPSNPVPPTQAGCEKIKKGGGNTFALILLEAIQNMENFDFEIENAVTQQVEDNDSNDDDVQEFYNKYAKEIGFSIRILGRFHKVYFDFMRSFRVEFDDLFSERLISAVEIGLGASRELKYPYFPERLGWRYPGIGEFQKQQNQSPKESPDPVISNLAAVFSFTTALLHPLHCGIINVIGLYCKDFHI